MPKAPSMKLKDVNNADILNAIRKEASLTYQQRIPEATKANMKQTMDAMYNGANWPQRNEFIDALINRIGLVIVRENGWQNKFKEFKRGMLQHGDTIEEINVGLLKARAYDPDRDYMEKILFSQETPDVQMSLHRINRQDMYKVTINEDMLRRAFLDFDNGLNSFVSQLMAAPANSDELDEYKAITSLFKEMHDRDGMFNVKVPDVGLMTSTEAQAKSLLREMRAYTEILTFPSTAYNASRMPVHAKPDELMLFLTPQVKSGIDVNALAAAFNLPYAEAAARMITVPEEDLRMKGTQAILTTPDLFVIADTLLETRTQPNAAGLYNNHFYHHHQIISASRFAPLVRFSIDEGSKIELDPRKVTGVKQPDVVRLDDQGKQIGSALEDIERGGIFQVYSEATTNGEGALMTDVALSLEGAKSGFTRITNTGALYVGHDESAEKLTVIATAVFDESKTASVDVNLTGDIINIWPKPGVTTPPAPGTGE